MPVINRIADYTDEMQTWRRHLHENPELMFECHNTAAFIAQKLRDFGVDTLHEGIAKTGLVGIIKGRGEGPTIGLRADMDALPILEQTGLDYASKIPGKMHACGHDGHVTMLLGAAKYLAETRNFAGFGGTYLSARGRRRGRRSGDGRRRDNGAVQYLINLRHSQRPRA